MHAVIPSSCATSPTAADGEAMAPHVPSPHGVLSTPVLRKTKPSLPAHVHFVPATLAAVPPLTSAAVAFSLRQPAVPIDFETGHAAIPALASFHAAQSHTAAAFAPGGGGSRFRGGWSLP